MGSVSQHYETRAYRDGELIDRRIFALMPRLLDRMSAAEGLKQAVFTKANKATDYDLRPLSHGEALPYYGEGLVNAVTLSHIELAGRATAVVVLGNGQELEAHSARITEEIRSRQD